MVKVRVLTALALAAVLLLAVFAAPPLIWNLFVALLVILAAREWFALVAASPRSSFVTSVIAALLIVLSGRLGPDSLWRTLAVVSYVLAGAFWLLIVPFVLRFRPRLQGFAWRNVAGFVLLVPAGLAMVELRQADPWLVIAALAPVWVADISAFFVGRKLGRRKLAPSISPGKSWEGVAGAVAGVIVYGLILRYSVSAFSTTVGIGLTLAVSLFFTAMGVVGDLFESLVKRQAGVKDSGTLLPGHGGVLDRVDSVLSTLPFAGVLLAVWQWWS